MSEPEPHDERATFAQVVAALGPYLDEIVIAGGWAHRLHRLDERSALTSFDPLGTDDADIAVLARLALRARRPIDALLGDLGFEEKLGSNFNPPMTRYERADFDVEFITPLRGGASKGGKPDATLAVAGITAQKLRYVDLLTERPWTVRLSAEQGYPVGKAPISVRIPNPASFIAQKLLALPSRQGIPKQMKDVLYVHDTLMLFRDAVPGLRAEWTEVRATQHASVAKKLRDQCELVFDARSLYLGPALTLARSIGRPDVPTATVFVRTCRDALRELFDLP